MGTPLVERKTTYHIVAADIGGTNSRFAHFTLQEDGRLALVYHTWLETSQADSFPRLLKNLRQSAFPFDLREADIVAIAIAGPVIEGVRSAPPLIPWAVDISNAEREYGIERSFLINDFVAQAFACLSPVGKSAEIILEGSSDERSAIAVIGAGTGLGKAVLVPDGRGGYHANPSEGAHAAFPFVSEIECTFQYFLLRSHQTRYVTYNHVVSGKGLSSIHEFLTGRRLEPAQVVTQFNANPVTLSWMARFYGRACRDFALETFARGGLYIVGGIAAKNPEIARHEAFRQEFLDSDTMYDVLSRLPVFLIRDQNSGLWGAATKACQELGIPPIHS